MDQIGWQGWFTAGLVGAMLVVLASGKVATDMVFLGVMLLLLLAGVLEPVEAIGGFASPGLATVAMLYVVATGLKETGAMGVVVQRLIGRPGSARQAQLRLALPVAGMSAFVNNTPIVAMFLPVLSGVARRSRIAASQLFMPLSFASILGGVCTLIGTSTNVIVKQALDEHNAGLGEGEVGGTLNMFTLTKVGIPIAVAGLAYILIFGRKLLPAHQEGELEDGVEARQYMIAMRVETGSPVIGKTVEKAGLRHLPGLFLSRIDRGEDESLVAVRPQEVLREGDILVFVGVLDSVVDLQKIKGLVPVTDEGGKGRGGSRYGEGSNGGGGGGRPMMRLIEAVVSRSNPFVGTSIRDAQLRSRYDAVVIAVHRHGHRLSGKVGDIVLREGDTLLLEAQPGFARTHRNSSHFYLVSELDGAAAPRHDKAWLAMGVLVALVLSLSFGWLAIMTSALAAAALMVVLRCCSAAQAREGLDWSVLLVIGSSFAIGRALVGTGVAEQVGHGLVVLGGEHPRLLLGMVYAVTVVFTALMTNNAAALLMFPIAVSISQEAGLNLLPVAACIAVAASCEFSTPIGYQTNLMVMGPGGYRWVDYLRFGGPLTVICGVVCVGLAPVAFGPLVGQ